MQINDQLPSRSFKPGACQKCGGDAFFDRGDESEWRCLQCGRALVSDEPVEADTWSFIGRSDIRTVRARNR